MRNLKRYFAKTKIVCTLGPASSTVEQIAPMVRSGMDVARINFSHGTHAEHLQTLKNLKIASSDLGEPVSVIQDLQGPKIRIGELHPPTIELKQNATVSISTNDDKSRDGLLSTTYKNLPRDVRPGDRVLLDDGKIELRVLSTREDEVLLTVVTGGVLTSHKGINLPGVSVSAPSLTEKDEEDLKFTFEQDVDYVAL